MILPIIIFMLEVTKASQKQGESLRKELMVMIAAGVANCTNGGDGQIAEAVWQMGRERK